VYASLVRKNRPVKHSGGAIPVLIPLVPQYRSLKKYLKRIDRSRTYSNFGPLNAELLHRLSVFLNVPERNIQTAANATLALEGAIRTSESSRTTWELPSWTFVATAHSALNANIKFQFVDVSTESWRAEFSGQSKNVIDVLPFGDGLDLERIPSHIEKIVVDGAASIAALRNCGLPNSPEFGLVVSLHATKSLPAGEGAFFITNSESWSRRFRQWTNFGFDNDRSAHFQSTNAKLSEYSAAVALASMDDFDKTSKILRKIQDIAISISQEGDIDVHPAMRKAILNPYWIVQFPSKSRKCEVVNSFRKLNIESRNWWGSGCHVQPLFKRKRTNSLRNTALLAETTLGVPFHPFMSESDFSQIRRSLFN
jgi:dTDP-4-amino-4,6-dideoxygalactose transaminase